MELDRNFPAARERIESLAEICETLEKRLEDARATLRRFTRRRTKSEISAPHDLVWLAGKHIHLIRPSKKLDYKYYDPFRVVEAVGPQAYRLGIAGHLNGIHPVFHIFLLEPVNRRGTEPVPTLHVELVDNEVAHEIRAIVDSRVFNQTLYYLIKWMGHLSKYNERYPVHRLPHAVDAIADFHRAHPTAVGPAKAQITRKEGKTRPRGRPPRTRANPTAKERAMGKAETARRDTSTECTQPVSPMRRSRGRPQKNAITAATATAGSTQFRRRKSDDLRRQG